MLGNRLSFIRLSNSYVPCMDRRGCYVVLIVITVLFSDVQCLRGVRS